LLRALIVAIQTLGRQSRFRPRPVQIGRARAHRAGSRAACFRSGTEHRKIDAGFGHHATLRPAVVAVAGSGRATGDADERPVDALVLDLLE
jgi:hypothetical protein